MLKEKTIVIPGIFFDINPAHRRNLFNSPCHHFVRLSFGPPVSELDKGKGIVNTIMLRTDADTRIGLDAIARVLDKFRKGKENPGGYKTLDAAA